MQEVVYLGLDCRHHFGMAVPDGEGPDTDGKVQVHVAIHIFETGSLPSGGKYWYRATYPARNIALAALQLLTVSWARPVSRAGANL